MRYFFTIGIDSFLSSTETISLLESSVLSVFPPVVTGWVGVSGVDWVGVSGVDVSGVVGWVGVSGVVGCVGVSGVDVSGVGVSGVIGCTISLSIFLENSNTFKFSILELNLSFLYLHHSLYIFLTKTLLVCLSDK